MAVLVVVAFMVALIVDYAANSDGSVRNVSVEGVAVGGLSEEDVRARIQSMAEEFSQREVSLLLPDRSLVATASQLGFRVDVAKGVSDALKAGRGSLASIPFRWIGAFFTPYEVHLKTLWSAADAEEFIRGFQAIRLSEPANAQLIFADNPQEHGRSFQVVPGSTGEEITSEALRRALEDATERVSLPESLILTPSTIPPNVPSISLQPTVDYANQLTAKGLRLYIGDEFWVVSPDELRSWITLTHGNPPKIEIDTEYVGDLLEQRLSAVRIQGSAGHFDLIDGTPTVVGATPSFRCCTEGIGEKVFETVLAGGSNVQLTLTEDPENDVDLMEETGIRELVGQFTTYFTPGQSRVTNIRRIAEIVQGAIIAPGETWSVNSYVGRRTTAKGFVPGGVIYRGLYREDIGGGVSQFATTIFNAAFFAGLDFGEYQAHTLYISRYPYGREATISYPRPNLELINNTPYSIMLWPTSTEGSVTVSIYSTKHMDVVQSGQEVIQERECQRVITTRTRAYFDGTSEEDTVFAVYRPAEGLNCDGEPEVPPPDCALGQAAVDTNDDGWNDSCRPICTEGQGVPANCQPICEGEMTTTESGQPTCIPICGSAEEGPPGTCVSADWRPPAPDDGAQSDPQPGVGAPDTSGQPSEQPAEPSSPEAQAG